MTRLTWKAEGQGCHRKLQLLDENQETIFWVKHCGHPTALYPWYIHTDALFGPMQLIFHGTFQLQSMAKVKAIQLYLGEEVVWEDKYIHRDEFRTIPGLTGRRIA